MSDMFVKMSVAVFVAVFLVSLVGAEPPCPVTDGCINVPNKHVLDKDTFKKEISGNMVTTLFRVEGPMLEHFFYRLQCRLYVASDDYLSIWARFRNGSANDECVPFSGRSIKEVGCKMTADFIINEGTISRYWFLGNFPARFFFFFACVDTTDIPPNNERCNGRFYIDIVINKEEPLSADLDLIDQDLYEIFGLRLTDRRTRYLYLNDVCNDEFPPLPNN